MTFNGAVSTRMPTTSPGRYAGYDNGWVASLVSVPQMEFDKSIVDFPNIKRFPGGASNDMQRVLKSRATTLAEDLAQTRSLLAAQSVPSVSRPMLIILVLWLVVIFVGFSVLAPPNATTVFALVISALAVSGAIFLILELDQPFGGLIGISSEPMVDALHQLGK